MSPSHTIATGPWNPFQHQQQPPFSSSLFSSSSHDTATSSSSTPSSLRRKRPDYDTMQRRWNFRDEIEQPPHRRIHPHTFAGRNILQILYDRECSGVNQTTPPPLLMLPSKTPTSSMPSPNSTTSRVYEEDDSPIDHDKLAKMRRLHEQRSYCTIYPTRIRDEIAYFAEYLSTVKYQSSFMNHLGGNDVCDENGQRPESSSAVSTISIAFAPDAQTMASTHGDHTVKISCCHTGRCLQTLEGHPRTPWTVKYHPKHSTILASGCLGHQVRIWNWQRKVCLQMVRLDFAIISVSFHPTGSLLAIANGTRLHFWGLNPLEEDQNNDVKTSMSSIVSTSATSHAGSANINSETSTLSAVSSTQLTEMDQRHMLRCVHFPPDGKTIIVGGVNPSNEDPRRRARALGSGTPMSFYLRLWDFDINLALQTPGSTLRRAISHPRTFVPRALLYNDGGFDVSPDGKTLCACAEYWLPEGVDNAMDLLVQEEADEDIPHGFSDTTIVTTAEHTRVSDLLVSSSQRQSPNRSPSFNDEMTSATPSVPTTMPSATLPPFPLPPPDSSSTDFVPRTPPILRNQPQQLSPPSPPGRRFAGGLHQQGGREIVIDSGTSISTPPPPTPPPPPPAPGGTRPPHPLSIVTASVAGVQEVMQRGIGRYVPHVVKLSLEAAPFPDSIDVGGSLRGKHPGAVARGYTPRLGQLLEACPLDPAKASAVTCVKFSPSTDFCLIGYGVREPEGSFHPVSSLYRIRGGMQHVSTMLSDMDDVNIARFHPDSGHGFVYGTKQGRVRILSPRPWNYYHGPDDDDL